MMTANRDAKPIFTWIHLSDIHMGHGSATETRDQELVLDLLAEDISERVQARAVPWPQAIMVTGDVAYSGGARPNPQGKNREYEDARRWLASIAQRMKLTSQDVYIVPGNHDIQRSADKERSTFRLVEAIRSGRDEIDSALGDADDTARLANRFANFRSFVEAFPAWDPPIAPHGLWAHRRITTYSGRRLRIVGLNTAILCADDKDHGQLRLGKSQLVSTFVTNKSPDEEIVIVLTHHPLRGGWLHDERESEGYIQRYAHIHLSGHVHDPDSRDARSGNAQVFVQVAAGAAHVARSEAPATHGYNFAGIYELPDGTTELRVWPRRWSAKNPRFVRDSDGLPSSSDFATHPLASLGPAMPPTGRTTADTQPPTGELVDSPSPLAPPVHASDIPCDSPPSSQVWVGREEELQLLTDPVIRVLAITGIGGQGKSLLASQYISAARDANILWDWRDCRELGDTLQTQVLRVIERASGGSMRASDLIDAEPAALSAALFRALGAARWVLVFDNVDHYINVELNRPMQLLDAIVQGALTRQHHSKIILTCRPAVRYDDPGFLPLALTGLTLDNTMELFRRKNVDLHDPTIAKNIKSAHQQTEGHPLWLNLIATQISRQPRAFEGLLAGISAGKTSGLPMVMLRSIFDTLNDKQKHVLRVMGEAVRPETEDQLSRYMGLSYNQFSKAIKVLGALDLIVIKSAPLAQDTYELHPLIRLFLRTSFPKSERVNFIKKIARVFDQAISRLKPDLQHGASFTVLNNWVLRAELAINAKHHKEAIAFIHEVHELLLSAGYSEEFIRIASMLYSNLDWEEAALKEFKYFEDVVSELVTALGYMDRFSEAEIFLDRFEKIITGRGARYVVLCQMRAHVLWNKQEYEAAKDWARKGLELIQDGKLDTRHDCEHELALAQRDSGEVDAALKIFLKGHSLESVVSDGPPADDHEGEFYGNVGRCLFLRGSLHEALVAYRKSALLLEKDVSSHVAMNRAWARSWIAEALEKLEDFEMAYCFLRDAAFRWKVISPSRSRTAMEAAERIATARPLRAARLGDAELREECRRWLQR